MSLPLPLVAVFLLQSVRVIHISRPQWRRKKQLTSTTTRSSSSAPRPRPTTVPSPRPLNRDSAKAGKHRHASERREKSSLTRLGFLRSTRRCGKRGQVRREDGFVTHETACIMEQHPPTDTFPTPLFKMTERFDEFLSSQMDGFHHLGNPQNLQSHVSLAEALYYY